MDELPKVSGNRIYMSAKTGAGMEELLQLITDTLYADNEETTFLVPYDKGQIVSYLCENAEVLVQNYIEKGIYLVVNCHQSDRKRFTEYIVDEGKEYESGENVD